MEINLFIHYRFSKLDNFGDLLNEPTSINNVLKCIEESSVASKDNEGSEEVFKALSNPLLQIKKEKQPRKRLRITISDDETENENKISKSETIEKESILNKINVEKNNVRGRIIDKRLLTYKTFYLKTLLRISCIYIST